MVSKKSDLLIFSIQYPELKNFKKMKILMGEYGLKMTAIIRAPTDPDIHIIILGFFQNLKPLLICVKTKALPTIFLKLIK